MELNTGAGPSAALQRAAQKENREAEKAANQLEKERQAQERAQAKAQQAAEKERKAAVAAEEKEAAATQKKNASKDKGTLYFTAKVPATKASQAK
ncbi:hypothetical protein RQP54_16480 [Curvibacter sp. APW13]|uniref:hypothetical protein n=1 Tax=Curvibacter sp. APW13 TaxID=3077236 RepID=UPI0028DEE45D|nr:hypothetical protein [Curvibacter sp. APW13]MDT8992468.1 hypothetical protein [Curvibacter sp. APW13]